MAESERSLSDSKNAQIREREDFLDFFLLFFFNVSFVYSRSFKELALMNPYREEVINTGLDFQMHERNGMLLILDD